MINDTFQVVTFQLGAEKYGIDIMVVNSIVQAEGIRGIPNAPDFVQGIFNLRGEIIPVINLHKRFNIPEVSRQEDVAEWFDSMVIIQIGSDKIALMIDDVSRVITLRLDEIQPPPQTIAGIGREYVKGVYNKGELYLVILDIFRIFDPVELNQLKRIGG